MKKMTIGKLAIESGVNVTSVRFYERIGLMGVPERTLGRHRVYSNDHLRRLRFIHRARDLDFSIEEIRRLLALDEPARTSCREVQEITAAHLKNIRQKLASLRRIEDILARTLKQCSGKATPQCPILDLLNARTGDSSKSLQQP
jgi:MerR family transcriptional regulator, mercuric resistance operon regulatory protein